MWMSWVCHPLTVIISEHVYASCSDTLECWANRAVDTEVLSCFPAGRLASLSPPQNKMTPSSRGSSTRLASNSGLSTGRFTSVVCSHDNNNNTLHQALASSVD
ncbi:hypothetical protein BDY19DRAFT_346595 [Irpex rosettiformis]|uniref:Uncharacterized protein n=1 Tax=Irpex rosettiformis TaxID=378272 RepID=A0ACB8TWT3_9APHY|nr:hypothetical protein BDY19DRAFT_346595 [Irpex rosettiformis]